MPDPLRAIHEREGLNKWFQNVERKASASLVREFLANARHWDEGEANDSRHIYCRGKFFVLSPDTIRIAMGFPPLSGECAFQKQLVDKSCRGNLDKFLFEGREECWERRSQQTRWKVNKNAIVPAARWICELLESWVLGVAPQPTYSYKLCTLAYCLYKGLRVDLPWFVYESLMERKESGCEKGPGHGHLLHAIVKKHGISTSGMVFDVATPPNRKYEKILGTVEKPEKAKGAKARAREPEVGSSSGTPSDVGATLASMQRMMLADRAERDRQFEHTRANQRKLGQLMETLGQWQLANSPGTLYPPPPNVSPWYDSEGYEYPHHDEDDE